MAYIAIRKIKSKEYYCKVESYREDSKVKQRVLEYYGTTDPRKNPDAKPIIKHSPVASYTFGDAALIYLAAQKIGLIDIVNKYLPKRQGLPLGVEFFLTAAHRLLGEKPSSLNLARWVKTTHLPFFMNINADTISSDTQEYLMDRIRNKEMNIDHIQRISEELYRKALPLFGKDSKIFFYDLTSTYFEGTTCPIACLGYSRDGVVDKLQINIGMMVNGNFGIPVLTKVFNGNVHDSKTVFEMLYSVKFYLGRDDALFIMDRGMDSEDNFKILDAVNYDYIIGLRSNHSFVKELIEKKDVSHGSWHTLTKKKGEIKITSFQKNLYGKRRIVVLYYSQYQAALNKDKRNAKIEAVTLALKEEKELTLVKAQKLVKGASKYFILEEGKNKVSWRVDQVAINRAEKHDGKFCMITNLHKNPLEIYTLYFSKDKVEKGFRHMKQDVALHPTRKRLAERVIADVFVCHVAYLLLVVTEHLIREQKIELFWDQISTETKEIRLLKYEVGSENYRYHLIANNIIQKNIVDKLGLSTQTPK